MDQWRPMQALKLHSTDPLKPTSVASKTPSSFKKAFRSYGGKGSVMKPKTIMVPNRTVKLSYGR